MLHQIHIVLKIENKIARQRSGHLATLIRSKTVVRIHPDATNLAYGPATDIGSYPMLDQIDTNIRNKVPAGHGIVVPLTPLRIDFHVVHRCKRMSLIVRQDELATLTDIVQSCNLQLQHNGQCSGLPNRRCQFESDQLLLVPQFNEQNNSLLSCESKFDSWWDYKCPVGGIGRHTRLRIQRLGIESSSLSWGT